MDYNLIQWEKLFQNDFSTLFKSSNGSAISFYFHLDNSEVKKKFENLVVTCGGQFVETYFSMTPSTALMVDDKCVRNVYNRVSFKASYIIDCVSSGILMDIKNYVHNNISGFKDYDFMKILFLNESSFTENNSVECDEFVCSTISGDNQEISANRMHSLNENQNEKLHLVSESQSKVKCRSEKKCASFRKNSKFSEKESNPQIIQNKCLNPCSHCMIEEERNSEDVRSLFPYESNRIDASKNTDVYRSITNSGKHCITCTCTTTFSQNEDNVRKDNLERSERNDDILNSKKNLAKKKPEDLISKMNSRSEESNTTLNSDHSYKVTLNRTHNIEEFAKDSNIDTNSIYIPHSSTTRTIQIQESSGLSEDEDDIGPPTHIISKTFDKHSRNPFSKKEKEAILLYLIKHNAIHSAGGRNIWKRMENSKICPQRTWMSLQNHFKRSLLKELETFPFLTSEQIKAFRR